MKIAFIYEYGNEIWSSPYSLVKEFERRGCEVKRFHLSNGEIEKMPFYEPDIIITMDWKGIDIDPVYKRMIPKSVFKIRECGDTPQNYHNHLKCADGYDLLLTPDYQSHLNYLSLGYNCIWWTHFADSDIHNIGYSDVDSYPPVRSTRGHGGSQIMDYLSKIMPDKFINRNGLDGKEYGRFLNNSLIVFQNSRWKEITRRIFEGMACGAMVLTDRLPESTKIDSLFVENHDIVYYDNISDAISKINYYLCGEGYLKRQKIAYNGWEKVTKYHTQVNRVDEILNQYNIWKIK